MSVVHFLALNEVKIDGTLFQPAEKLKTISDVTDVIVKNAFTIAGLIALVLLIFGGFQFIVSAGSGDTKSTEKAKQAITSAVIGLIVVIASYWIVQIIEILTGVNLISK